MDETKADKEPVLGLAKQPKGSQSHPVSLLANELRARNNITQK